MVFYVNINEYILYVLLLGFIKAICPSLINIVNIPESTRGHSLAMYRIHKILYVSQ